jgi:hypothetical protein
MWNWFIRFGVENATPWPLNPSVPLLFTADSLKKFIDLSDSENNMCKGSNDKGEQKSNLDIAVQNENKIVTIIWTYLRRKMKKCEHVGKVFENLR